MNRKFFPAFPTPPVRTSDNLYWDEGQAGMDLFDYFAGQALVACYKAGMYGDDTLASECYDMAHAMMKEREARQ